MAFDLALVMARKQEREGARCHRACTIGRIGVPHLALRGLDRKLINGLEF